MAGPTRRTHIVRCSPDSPPGDTYVDVEVLDAISFDGPNGIPMILNIPIDGVKPYIVDNTGGNHGKTPSNATRRSHMKRVKGESDATQMLDIDVLEVITFNDENGVEWILDMHATTGEPSVFNKTDNTGDSRSTRRTHSERVSVPYTDKDPKQFITVERCDAMAFRTINGEQVIIKCPSNDDYRSSDPRAETHVTSPKNYDPANDDGPKPPENKDAQNYVKFVKDASGILTGKTKLSMGPLWWIRKIGVGGAYILVKIISRNTAAGGLPPFPEPTIDFGANADTVVLLDTVETRDSGTTPPVLSTLTIYFTWRTDTLQPFPTVDNWDMGWFNVGTISEVPFAGQFKPIADSGNGIFNTFEGADDATARLNAHYTDGGYYTASLDIPETTTATSFAETTTTYLLKIPTKSVLTTFDPHLMTTSGTKTSHIYVQGYTDVGKGLKKITDLDGPPPIVAGPDRAPDFGNKITPSGTFKVTTEVLINDPPLPDDPSPKAHYVDIKIRAGGVVVLG